MGRGVAAWLVMMVGVPLAHADRVVVMPVSGTGGTEVIESIEDHLAEAVRALSHEALTEARATEVNEAALPETANDMRAVAEIQGAQWAVLAIVRRNDARSYWLTLRVGFAALPRIEELEIEVWRAREADRLREALQAMLRPEGLGEDGIALAGEDRAGREAADGAAQQAADEEAAARAERERLEAEQRAREEQEAREREERERLEAERRERDAQHAYETRDRYGVADGLTLIQVGAGVRPLIATDARATGGVLGTVELRVGRGFEGLPGLEIRGGLEIVFGAASAFSVLAGAAYLFSPFVTPLHLGATIELGFFQTLSGQRGPAFTGRLSALISYNLGGSWYLEASLPELMYLTTGGGAFGIGASVRLGVRF